MVSYKAALDKTESEAQQMAARFDVSFPFKMEEMISKFAIALLVW